MPNNKKVILGIMALLIVFGAPSGQVRAATSQPAATSQVPITIEADDLTFSEETGDIVAKGQVVITNQGQRVEASQINGNTKLNEIWINDQANFSQPDAKLSGSHTVYNYKLKTGSMEDIKGKIGHKYVAGGQISMQPDQFVINNGSTTNCPAKVPDYHISADKIEIWPDDHMVAYNAKFWIGDKVIFSLPKYRQSLKKGEDSMAFPRIGYDNDDGISIKQHIEYPFDNKLSAYVNLDYYSQAEFKPSVGLIQREKNYSLDLTQGHFRDNDSNWIKKEPELKFSYYPNQLGSLPVHYTFTAIYGKWIDDDKSSWHQDYSLYFTHDPIKLNGSTNLYLGAGLQHVRESYDNSTTTNLKYDATIDKKWSERFSTWAGYHYNQNNPELFEYDTDEINRELAAGFTYKIDRMNTIGISQSYDMDTDRLADVDYVWYRNLHCWEAKLTYRAKRDQIKFDVSTIKW